MLLPNDDRRSIGVVICNQVEATYIFDEITPILLNLYIFTGQEKIPKY